MQFLNLAVLALATASLPADYSAQLAHSTPKFLDNYSVFKETGGIGPYSVRRSAGLSTDIPEGFHLDQIVLFHRHGERYPDSDDYVDYKASLDKFENRTSTPRPFEFLYSWTPFVNDSNFGNETSTGPYSGLAGSFFQGEQFFERYGELVKGQNKTKIWSSSSTRVLATAESFADGFFAGRSDLYDIIVVEENEYANSLTPKCKGASDTTCPGGETTLVPQFDAAAARLNKALGINLKASDVENLMDVAMYEINARGNSPWLDVFTPDEWVALEYVRSYRVFCKRAHGSPKGMASGSILTNATQALLSEGPGGVVQPLTMVFLHDTQISEIVGAAGFFNQSNHFVANQTTFGNQIQISDIVPMGANLAFESFTNCNETYVRIVLNEAVMPIDWCLSGPGYSCPLTEFVDGINKRYEVIGWEKNCKKRHKDDPDQFTIFWE